MLEIIINALVSIGDSIMSLFSLGHAAEKRIASSSVVGESEQDRDARRWHRRIIDTWWFLSFLICLVVSGFGYAIWRYFH